MKYNTKQYLKIVSSLFVLLVVFIACNDQNDLGLGILPEEDLINVKNIVVKDQISTFTFSEKDIVTSSTSTNLLGSVYDPVFGKTTVDFATQFRLTSYPDFGTNPVTDSVKLYLYYRNIFGDTTTAQHISVYELETGLDPDIDYTQDVDLKSMASTFPLAEYEFTPKVSLDSATQDTNYQVLAIHLDHTLGEKLVNADSVDLINNDVFLEFFKGLFIETEDLSGTGGTLVSMHTASSSSFQGSALVVYYNNDENQEAEEPDTLSQAFIITEYSARVSGIEHDYTGTPFIDNIDQEEVEDDLIYVQPTGGLKSKVNISGLESWKDSTNMAINKAQFIFQVDTIASDIQNYPPPQELILTFVDVDGDERIPVDYYFNSNFYGGVLDTADYTYSFNITQHVQSIIDVTDPEDDDYVGNQGFFLTTGQRSDHANRVVLKSAKNDGVQLSITYTKFIE